MDATYFPAGFMRANALVLAGETAYARDTANVLWHLDPHDGSIFPLAEITGGAILGANEDGIFYSGSGALFFANAATGARSVLVGDQPGTSFASAGKLLDNGLLLILRAADVESVAVAKSPSGTVEILHSFLEGQTVEMTPPSLGGNWAVLSVRNPDETLELWRTDGSIPGTVNLMPATPLDVDLSSAERLDDHAIFRCGAAGEGLPTLCSTDGTSAGTSILDVPFSVTEDPVCGSDLCFAFGIESGHRLVRTDGTDDGTMELALPSDMATTAGFPHVVRAGLLLPLFDSKFQPRIDVVPGDGAPSYSISSCEPESCEGPVPAGIWTSASLGDSAVFTAYDSRHGRELWSSDGTLSGTRRLRDVEPGTASSDIHDFRLANGVLYFLARTTIHGEELWRTDGTVPGTGRMTDFENSEPFIALGPSLILVADEERILFAAEEPSGHFTIWRMKGFDTDPVVAVQSDPAGKSVISAELRSGPGGFAFFGRDSFNRWYLHGVSAFDLTVSAIELGSSSQCVAALYCGGILPFAAGFDSLWLDSENPPYPSIFTFVEPSAHSFDPVASLAGRSALVGAISGFSIILERGDPESRLWKTSPSHDGIELVDVIAANPFLSSPSVPHGTRLFFQTTESGGRHLRFTDGVAGGTGEVPLDALGIQLPTTSPLLSHSSGLVFVGMDGAGWALWTTDGTSSGTVRLTPPELSVADEAQRVTSSGGWIYFVGTMEGELRLFRSAGAPGSMEELITLEPPEESAQAGVMAPVLQGIVFRNRSAEHGDELWLFDSTTVSTSLLADILAGPRSSTPGGLTVAGTSVYFSARDDDHGIELWRTDGTPAGTALVADINPGPLSSVPSSSHGSPEGLVFLARHNLLGREPWALRFDGQESSMFFDGFESRSLAAWSATAPRLVSPRQAYVVTQSLHLEP